MEDGLSIKRRIRKRILFVRCGGGTFAVLARGDGEFAHEEAVEVGEVFEAAVRGDCCD